VLLLLLVRLMLVGSQLMLLRRRLVLRGRVRRIWLRGVKRLLRVLLLVVLVVDG
jgi:hypothetical protein